MIEIDVEQQKTHYQAEHDRFVVQLQQLDNRRAILIQAIQERRGILAFLNSLSHQKESA